jgi:hypothetical protein
MSRRNPYNDLSSVRLDMVVGIVPWPEEMLLKKKSLKKFSQTEHFVFGVSHMNTRKG